MQASLSSQMSDPAAEIIEDVPPWRVSNFEFDDEGASFAIRCNSKLFYVDVSVEDLGDWSRRQEFVQLLQEVSDDFDAEVSLYDLISRPCTPLFKTYALGAKVSNPFMLQKYYDPEVLTFKLVGDGEDVKAIRSTESYQKPAKLAPQIALSEISDSSKVFHLDASTITIMPRDGPETDVTSDNPSTVSVDGTSTRYHFKAVQDLSSFLREFGILLRLKEARLNMKYRLPTIHSLVHYANDPHRILGILLEYIDNGHTLADWIETRKPSRALKEKWNRQVRDTVAALHRSGIIWGDVKPENVFVDREHNTWLIDFGGGFNSSYVDEDVMETVEGDWQGVSRITEALLR
jgi:hypothetical protein